MDVSRFKKQKKKIKEDYSDKKKKRQAKRKLVIKEKENFGKKELGIAQ